MRNIISSLTVIIFLISSSKVVGQINPKIDSLKQVLTTSATDSAKVQLYGQIAWAYASTRIQTAEARTYADSIRLIAERTQDQYYIARYNFYYGVVDRLEGKNNSGIYHMNKYVAYNKRQGDSSRVAGGLFQIAAMQSAMGVYEKAIATHYRVLSIEEQNNDQNGIAYTKQGIGIALFETQRHNEALVYLNEALALYKKLNRLGGQANVHVTLGNVYTQMSNIEDAKENYEQALRNFKKINSPWGIALTQSNIGHLNEKTGNFNDSKSNHLKALKIRESLPNKELLTRSLLAVGVVHHHDKEYNKALEYFNRAKKTAKETDSKSLMRDIQFRMSETFAAMNNYKAAFEARTAQMILKDSIYDKTKAHQIADLQTKYETEQKDKEILTLTRENEIQQVKADTQTTIKNAVIGGIFLIGIIAGLIIYNLRQRLKSQKLLLAKNEQLKNAKLKEQLQDLEMKALRAQMNPHFLFNCLNAINTMILQNDGDNASRYLAKFSKLVRLILENSEQQKVSLKDELDMLESYIQLEAIRFNNKMDYDINVDESIDQFNTFIPSMVLQPFVENGIWHGLLHKEKKGLLTINIKENNDDLLCEIIDNGIGREKSLSLEKQEHLKKKSMGIKITTERLKILTQQKMNELVNIIDLKDENNNALGTKVNIAIPTS
ncbi:tetratricopeptide repeat-containing sensor histidine kinase [Spongiivirga citrea]|uniref:Tetratricopeptide repeat protein n=1 Tax=Spongiivirga citrea TaxID=1481457 RepID=A0A6M0CHE0_9FLAO|nr:histidine kinase [Spongiivirga citrea]NER17265.1 tetratricopeptide repeat protein [Spongiivirga citrea]